jgi:cyanate permease
VASLAPLVPVIQADLQMSHSAMGSVMGAWQLVYIVAAIPCGMLLDRLGGRWALTLGVALVVLSGLGRAVAESYPALLLAVMLFGLGGPIISSGAPKIVTGIFQGSQRGLAMGIYMTGPTLGGILALTLTHSLLLPAFDGSWRWVLVFWSAFALAGMLAWFVIASLAGPRVPGFIEEPQTGGSSAARPGGVAGILRAPAVQVLLLMAVGAFLFNHGLNNWLPELLRSGGLSVVEAGYWAAFPLAVGILGSLTIPRLATPERRFGIIFGLCIAAAVVSLALQYQHPLVLGVSLFLQGLVRSSLMTVLILTLVELPLIDTRQTGTASGLFFSAAEVGGVLGPLGLGFMYDLTGGFDAGLYLLAAIAAAMAAGTLLLSRLARPSAELSPPTQGG